MTLSEALDIVLNLASENALTPEQANELGSPYEYNRQQCALDIVARLYAEECKEEKKHAFC